MIKVILFQCFLMWMLALGGITHAQLSGSTCLAANGGNSCTAKDLKVTGVTLNKIVEGCTGPTDTAIVDLTATIESGSSQRYDVGIWISETGGSALTGTQCFRDYLPTADSYPDEEGSDADSCGTVTKNTSTTRDMFSVTLPCSDIDGDTLAEVDTCLSWKQSSSSDCFALADAVPGSGSKCRCGVTDIDGLSIPDLSITKTCSPDNIAPGDTLSCTIEINNATGAGLASGFHFEDDYPEDYGTVSNVSTTQGSTSDDGDILTINTGDISAGTTITITYDFTTFDEDNLPNGEASDSFINVVNTYYTNVDGVITNQNLTAFDSATLPVTLSYIATRYIDGVMTFEWTTQTETGNLGFNVQAYDAERGTLFKINPEMIPSQAINSVKPLHYQLPFPEELPIKQYYIDDIDIDGKTTRNGPYQFGVAYGEPHSKHEAPKWRELHGINAVAREKRHNNLKKLKTAITGYIDTVLLGINSTGIQRVAISELDQMGFNTQLLRGHNASLTDGHHSVPYNVNWAEGYLEFFGKASDALYSQVNFFQLSTGKGLPTPKIRKTGNHQESTTVYTKRLTLTEPKVYSIAVEGADPWYDASLVAIHKPKTIDYTIDTPHVEPGTAEISVSLFGITNFPETNDHHIEVRLNGQLLVISKFDGRTQHAIETRFDASLLNTDGSNKVSISALADNPRKMDVVLVKEISLSHPGKLLLQQGDQAIEVRAPEQTLVLEIPSSQQPIIYRVNEHLIEQVIPQFDSSENKYLISTNNSPEQLWDYFIATHSGIHTPSVKLPEGQPVAYSQAAHLIIVHPDLVTSALNDYLSVRAGYISGDYEIINIYDIYAAYSDHEVDAQAIREFIRWSSSFGNLQSVMLVGGDSYDYHDRMGMGAISFIPTLYRKTSTMVAQTPTDALLTDTNNDSVSDYPIGRLAARSPSELQSILDKSTSYWQRSYTGSALFIADKTTDRDDTVFHEQSDAMNRSLVDLGWQTQQVQIDGPNAMNLFAARQTIIDSMNRGVGDQPGTSMVVFNGHSSLNFWTFGGLFNSSHIDQLTNTDNPFSLIQWGCWNTYFVAPHIRSMADRLLTEHTGAAVVIGSSTLSTANSQADYAWLVMDAITRGRTIGQAIVDAKQHYSRLFPDRKDITLGINVMGDPMLVID